MVVSGVCYVVYMFLPILIIFNYQLYGWNIPLLQIYGWAGKWFVIDFCLVILKSVTLVTVKGSVSNLDSFAAGKTHTPVAVNPDIYG